MNTPADKSSNMDRRSFLKVTMLASGALMIGVGCKETSSVAATAQDRAAHRVAVVFR